MAVMPSDWEGSHESGVALTMRCRLKWFIHLQARGLREGDEHSTYTLLKGVAHYACNFLLCMQLVEVSLDFRTIF